MATTPQRLDAPPPLKAVLMSQGLNSTQGNLRRSINSTQDNLRGYTPPAVQDPFSPPLGSTGGLIPQQQSDIDRRVGAMTAATRASAPPAPAPQDPFSGPGFAPVSRGDQFNPMATPGVRTAGALANLQGLVPAMAYNTALRGAGINLNPVGQAPGDFGQNVKAAISTYNRVMSGMEGAAGAQVAAGPNIEAFAPTGLRERAIGAQGKPVDGFGGVQVSAMEKPGGGYNFNLVGAGARGGLPAESPAKAQPQNQNSGPTPFQRDAAKYNAINAPTPKLERIESGDDIVTVDVNSGNVVATAPRSTIPSGYERTDEGIRPMKGSPDAVKQGKEQAAFEKKLVQEQDSARNVLSNIDFVLENASGLTSGPGGKIASVVWGTDAYDVKQALETIKANIGFDRLQAMREASPTGGALGQVAIQELNALQNSLRSLEQAQSPDRFKKNLQAIRYHYERYITAESGRDPDKEEAPKAQKAGRFEILEE